MLQLRSTLLLVASMVVAASCAGCPYAADKQKVNYESYTGKELSDEEYQKLQKENKTVYCAVSLAPCDPEEGRRVDGSCTNLKYPTYGTGFRPFARVLPAMFGKGSSIRPLKSGKPRSSSRQKRTKFTNEGAIESQEFTNLLNYNIMIISSDSVNVDDTVNYIMTRPYCCKPEGANDPLCAPYGVPEEDPTLRFSNIHCLNLTIPISYQSQGCLPNDTEREWVNMAPPLLDLSVVYGETYEALNKKGRTFEGGLLKHELDHKGRMWYPNITDMAMNQQICFMNSPELNETRCHESPTGYTNAMVGINLFSLWYMRQHNRIASELAQRNPCWDDEKLFDTARDINLAMYHQMIYYELFPTFMGYENLINDRILSSSPGFRDIHDDNVIPRTSVEAIYVTRWFHVIQHSNLKLYDASGNYMKNYPLVNMTSHTGLLYQDDNVEWFTQGGFRQGCANFDNTVDPDMVTIGMGSSQDFIDILSNDLQKDGLFGLPPYTHYREYCTGKAHKSFEDLAEIITPERMELLKDNYEHVEDIELLSGLWLENNVPGGQIPATMYCIMQEQLYNTIASDRHWFERPNRPNAFTAEQLEEVRKATVAQLVCDVGDNVSEIQPHAYLRAGPGNEMTSCTNIPTVNFDAWKDSSC